MGIYRLATAGKHGSFTAKNTRVIKLRSAVYNAANDTVAHTPRKSFSLTKPVQLQVNGTPPSGLQDIFGRFIDGRNNALAVLQRQGATITAVAYNPVDLRQVITPCAVDVLVEREGLMEVKHFARIAHAKQPTTLQSVM